MKVKNNHLNNDIEHKTPKFSEIKYDRGQLNGKQNNMQHLFNPQNTI